MLRAWGKFFWLDGWGSFFAWLGLVGHVKFSPMPPALGRIVSGTTSVRKFRYITFTMCEVVMFIPQVKRRGWSILHARVQWDCQIYRANSNSVDENDAIGDRLSTYNGNKVKGRRYSDGAVALLQSLN